MKILREYMTEHRVWRANGWVYKQQPKFLTDNEIGFLQAMASSGYVPRAEQVSKEVIKMEDLGESEPVTCTTEFMAHLPKVLSALMNAGIRHGDLSIYGVIVKNNKPFLIDFAESRIWNDPRPDKRPEGDKHWLTQTMGKLCS